MEKEIQKKIKTIVGSITIIVLVFLAYDASSYLTDDYQVNPVPYDRFDVVVLGDSITEGLGTSKGNDYVSLLRDHTGVKIRNSGIRNDESGDGLARLESDVLSYNPDIVLIFLGGNDFIHRVPKEETFSNLKEIITKLQDKDIAVLLVGVQGGLFFDACRPYFNELAEETEVFYIPNVLDGVIGKFKYMKDPLHPNDDGHMILFERIAPELDKLLEIYY